MRVLKKFNILLILSCLFVFNNILYCQPEKTQKQPLTRILFVFDASRSMSGMWENDVKINIARKVLIGMIDTLQYNKNVQMALRIYGHQSTVPPQDCNDTKLEVPFDFNNASLIRQRLRYVVPKGTTPIANSLELAAKDFPPCKDCRNILILITDGVEACEGDPCKVSEELQKAGIILKPFVIGIGIDEEFKESFNCIGNFYNATNEDRLKQALDIAINQVLNKTTVQVNLLDIKGLPTETDVAMTFYDKYSGKVKYNFIHTINHRGNPDTIYLDPLLKYKLEVHTLPPIEKDNISISSGGHTVIALDAPQGFLKVVVEGSNQYRDQQIIVRKGGDLHTLNVQKINQVEKYLIGKYDLEIPVLPRLNIKDVEIKPGHTTTVTIPQPGMLKMQQGSLITGSLYAVKDDDIEWIANLDTREMSIAQLLLPGEYLVIYRPLNAKFTYYSDYKYFTIKEGGSVVVDFK
ncbi:MAG: VWA domain-containing protein [Bacteroidales bacterium]|nr:VWA domain-containing protein [Bacteroidales bacterium]